MPDDADATGPDAGMPHRFDTRIAVVLRDDLAPWQALNVTAFVTSGIAVSGPEVIGEPYQDADGNRYLPMLREPVIVLAAGPAELAAMRARAVGRGIPIAVYTADLFATGHDAANRAAVAAVPAEGLDLVGIALRGPKNVVDRIAKVARRHP